MADWLEIIILLLMDLGLEVILIVPSTLIIYLLAPINTQME